MAKNPENLPAGGSTDEAANAARVKKALRKEFKDFQLDEEIKDVAGDDPVERTRAELRKALKKAGINPASVTPTSLELDALRRRAEEMTGRPPKNPKN